MGGVHADGNAHRPRLGLAVGLTVAEAAELLRMSKRFVYRLCGKGMLQHWKLGGRIRIGMDAINAYLDGQKRGERQQDVAPRRKLALSCLKLR